MVRRDPIEGQLQDLDLASIDHSGVAEPTSVVGQGSTYESVSFTEIDRPSCSVHESVAIRRISGLALGSTEPNGQIDPDRWIGIAELRIELEGLGVVLQGVRRC